MRGPAVFAAALTLAVTSSAGMVTAAPTATALTPPVGLTADDLSTWQTNGIVWALAEADGVVFAGGTFSAIRPKGSAAGTNEQPAVNFAAFNAATGAPTSCKLSFTVGSGSATVRALAVSPDRRTLYAGGFFGAVNGVPVSSFAAIDIATCTPRTGFAVPVNATVRALAASDDTVYLGGDFTTVDGQPREKFAAVTASDAALTPFRANADEAGRAVELTPDGRHVLLGGDFFTVNRADSHALAVVDASTGELVKRYPEGFFPPTSVVKDITTDATGFYTAHEGTGGGVYEGRTALNLSDYSERWRDTCLGATQSVAVHGTVLYSGSHAHDCSSMGGFPNQRRKHLLAESVNDPTLLPWFPDTNDGIGEGIGPRVMTTSSVGGVDYLWVGGEFTTVNGVAQQGVTRFASTPDTGAPSVPWTNVSSIKPGEVTVRWQSSLDLDDGNLTYAVYKNGSATPVYTTTGYSLPWVRPQLTWTDTDVTPGSTYTYRITASDGTNTSAKSATQTVVAATTAEAYPAQVLADGANLYWRYNETSGTFAADTSAGEDNGVHVGGPSRGTTPAAVPGSSTAIGYNGSTQWTYSDRRHSAPGAFTIETWFKTTTTSGGKLVGWGNRTVEKSTVYDKHLYMTNNGQLVFGVYNLTHSTISTGPGFNDGKWHHVVATLGGGGMRLYVDGTLRASSLLVTSSQNKDGYWRIGGDSLSGWPNRSTSDYFAGQLDETAVYPKVLSSSQVAKHYSLGTSG